MKAITAMRMLYILCFATFALSACGSGVAAGSAAAAAAESGSDCLPRVGVYATDLAGDPPSANINTAIASMVSDLQQLEQDLGLVVVNKVTGFEDEGSVHYQVFINTEADSYRLVDSETGVIMEADSADAPVDWSIEADEVATWVRTTVKTAIDSHDLVTLGAGPAVDVAPGSTTNLSYSVSTEQGAIVAQSTVGTLGGTALEDGRSAFRVSGAVVEDFTLSVPLNTAAGSYSVAVQSACRYDTSTTVAALEPITINVSQSALVGLWCARRMEDLTFNNGSPTLYDGDCTDNADYLRIYESDTGLRVTPLIGLCEDEVPASDPLVVLNNAMTFVTRTTGSLNFQACTGDSFSYGLSLSNGELTGQYIADYSAPNSVDQEIAVIYTKESSDPCESTNWDHLSAVQCQ